MLGKILKHYEIGEQLGAGGMGAVYRARDQKLGREVAIKVLPEEFGRDTDRIARFQREAKLLASLNHPNIAAIHGLEESNGTNFLVLELVEGQTLAERIKAGPIPVEESLKLALQIAEALEAAHEKGVIHRDLKPANIKVTPDGKVKVLDFGLAKAYAGDREEVNLSNSPTLSNAATQQGVILGTAAYMSPEQARGKTVDKRTDIWAFGCVLFEMLASRAAFFGSDVSDILAAVIRAEPEWDSLPANLHWRLREVIDRCLKKDPKDRYHDISDVRADLLRIVTDPGGLAQPITAVPSRAGMRTVLPWFAAVIGIALGGTAVWRLRPSEPRQVMRFDYDLPGEQQFSNPAAPLLAVSPDGRQFVYSTPKGLYSRPVDALTAKLVPGTEGTTQQPFFSPDGKWIGYFSENQLRKIPVSGGDSIVLCALADSPQGATWYADDTIVFGTNKGLMRISANGGTPEFFVRTHSQALAAPQILPNGQSVLYSNVSLSKIVVKSLEPGEYKELFAGRAARYLPTGHIVYTAGNDLWAVPFNAESMELSGGHVPLIEAVWGSLYAVSDSGTMVYVPGKMDTAPQGRTLVWVDRNGKEEPISAQLNRYQYPKISPDGAKVALAIAAADNSDIWILDIARNTLTRLTFEGANSAPVWTPDGKKIAFYSFGRQDKNLNAVYWKAADGSGIDEELGSRDIAFIPCCWSSDGKALLGAETIDYRNFDIGMLSIDIHLRKPLLRQEYLEIQPQLSPDGRWIAYASNESHKNEIYVRPFPDVNMGRWQISTEGGDSPLWSPDGLELFYLNGDAVMAASVKTGSSFSIVGAPRVLFQGTYVSSGSRDGIPWDISPDGKRFLMMKPSGASTSASGGPRKVNVVVNWLEELKKRVPVK